MKLFPIKGGIHPEYRKELTSEKPIVALPIPAVLTLPVQQHMGAAASTVVKVGDQVLKGQMLARGQGAVSAPVHAPPPAPSSRSRSAPRPTRRACRC